MPSVEFVETVEALEALEALEAAEQLGEAELVNSTLTDTETARLSEGEILIKVSSTSEEGEVSAGDSLRIF